MACVSRITITWGRNDLPWGSGTAGCTLCGATGPERGNSGLGNHSTQLSRGGREPVGCRSVSGREAFSRNDECGCVGTKVEEELGKNVDGEKTVTRKMGVCEAKDAEENGQNDEAHELNRLTTPDIDGGN